MLITLIQKEIMHHILSVRFIALLLMCALLIPLTLSISYRKHRQSLTDYQESVNRSRSEAKVNPPNAQDPDVEVSKLFLKPMPLSVFANGLEEVLPTHLGMTRNGIRPGSTALAQAPLAYVLGNLDFLFIVGTVFSLLALLFTFDAVAGEREAGTLRINLSNPVPRDVFLWSKLIGGYVVFVLPFLVSFLLGLLLIVWQGFPLGELKIAMPVLGLTLVSLLYIAVFFAIGVVISTYLDNAKTALIVAFTFWVFAVLIAPRGAFVIAKLVAPTRTQQTVYMEKTALRNNLAKETQEKLNKKIVETFGTKLAITPEVQKRLDKIRKPINEESRLKFQNQANKIDNGYQREKDRQEHIGEMLSRLVPTSSLIYSAINLTQTGKLKRDLYFQTGERYYKQLDDSYFSGISDDVMAQVIQIMDRQGNNLSESDEIPPPPPLTESALSDTLRRSAVDVCLLGFFALAFTAVAFLKFFRSDI
ncbi:ABC transporter permease subunit [Candidatus Poribacteria bacterium]|nr:ABC transporter permease subunit [Candidatus Poribacteria bacterium]